MRLRRMRGALNMLLLVMVEVKLRFALLIDICKNV
jgi:hypothetical protein